MSKVADDIREKFQNWKKHTQDYDQSPCESNPFLFRHWMYYYLFPEILIVGDWGMWGPYRKDFVFPCWYIEEEEVFRIMSECGIL